MLLMPIIKPLLRAEQFLSMCASTSRPAMLAEPDEYDTFDCRGHRERTLVRVLHVINGEHYSGAERVQDLLALDLRQFGFDVGFACLKPGRFAAMRVAQQAPIFDAADAIAVRSAARAAVGRGDSPRGILAGSHAHAAGRDGRPPGGGARRRAAGAPRAQSHGQRLDARMAAIASMPGSSATA